MRAWSNIKESKLHLTITQMIKSHTTSKEHKNLVEEAKSLRELWKQHLQGTEEEKKEGSHGHHDKQHGHQANGDHKGGHKGDGHSHQKDPEEPKLQHQISAREIALIGKASSLTISISIEVARIQGLS